MWAAGAFRLVMASDVIDNRAEFPDYEIVRSDAAWCGPRLLYFFSVYLDRERPLNQVIGLCAADATGFVSFEAVELAARELGLEPTAVQCSAQAIAESGGPAMLVINKGSEHFVGLIAYDGHICTIVDPSRPSSVHAMPIDDLKQYATGHAIFLKGARIPRVTFPILETIAVLLGFGSVVLVVGIRVQENRRKNEVN
jgi:ABC-type bacteriocin/lantibiotic exporter with double-glycine peptidase domain